MKHVWLVQDIDNNKVIALYDDAALAQKMLPKLEEKFNAKLYVVKRSINLEIGLIGIKL